MYFVADRNITSGEGQACPQLLSLIQYGTRYHLTPTFGPKKLLTHAAITYYDVIGQCISKGDTKIIGTAVIIIDMVNAEMGIAMEHNPDGYTDRWQKIGGLKARREALRCLTKHITSVFWTLEERTVKFDITELIENLGKNQFLFL